MERHVVSTLWLIQATGFSCPNLQVWFLNLSLFGMMTRISKLPYSFMLIPSNARLCACTVNLIADGQQCIQAASVPHPFELPEGCQTFPEALELYHHHYLLSLHKSTSHSLQHLARTVGDVTNIINHYVTT